MFKVLRFPSIAAGAILSINKSNRIKISCLFDPFSIDIRYNSQDSFEETCKGCFYYKPIDDITKLFIKTTGFERADYKFSVLQTHRRAFMDECELCDGGTLRVFDNKCRLGCTVEEHLYGTKTIHVPKSLMSIYHGSWKLFAVTKDGTYVPYRLANVYRDGEICWGRAERPRDHLEAFNTFFTSNFNRDLAQGTNDRSTELLLSSYDHEEYAQRTSPTPPHLSLEEATSFRAPDLTLKVATKRPQAMVVADRGKLFETVPLSYHYRPKPDKTYVVGWIKKTPSGYLTTCRDLVLYSKTLSTKSKFEILGAKNEIF
jgi:hypothetical protein